MFSYWLSVLLKTFSDSVAFIGQTGTAISFSILVIALTVVWSRTKRGSWKEALKHFWSTVDSLLIIVAGFLLVCWVHFVNEPHLLDNDMQMRLANARSEVINTKNTFTACGSQLVELAQKSNLLGQQLNAQQSTINSQQTQLNSQQGTINSCVVSLGKMNPVINTKMAVTTVRTGTPLRTSPTFSWVFIITTNRLATPTGTLKCDRAFTPVSLPFAGAIPAAVSMTSFPLTAISDHEYVVRAAATGYEWGPNGPITFMATSQSGNLGKCSFVPQ